MRGRTMPLLPCLAWLALAQGLAAEEPVTFCFSRGQSRYEITVNPATPVSASNLPSADDEKAFYDGTGYLVAEDNFLVNGYRIGKNEPTSLQNCGGLSLARLIGGPHKLPTNSGWEFVQRFGETIEGPLRAWDVAVWRAGNVANHFALVLSPAAEADPSVVVSKESTERVYFGRADKFPEKKGFGKVSFFRIHWDTIDVYRKGDKEVAVPQPAGAEGHWGPTPPRPRLRKALIEAAEDCAKRSGIAKYKIESEGCRLAQRHPGGAATEYYLRVQTIESLERAQEYVRTRLATLEKQYRAQAERGEIGGEQGGVVGPVHPRDFKNYVQYVWTCAHYFVSVEVTCDHFAGSGHEAGAGPDAQNACAARLRDAARAAKDTLSAKLILNGLKKPERPPGVEPSP